MNNISILSDYLGKCDGKVTDVLYEIWSIIDNCEDSEKIAAFRFFFENQKIINSDGSLETKKSYFTDAQISTSIERLINKDINGKIEKLTENAVKNNYSEDRFYELLWEIVVKSSKTKRDKAMALFFIMENALLPYKNVGTGKEMSQEDYENYIDKIGQRKIDEINYIFGLPLEQKTQTSSLLLERLLDIDDKNEQIVLLSIILEQNNEKVKNELKTFIDRL